MTTQIGLSGEYIQATEWNLATLEELACLRGTSKSRINRQCSICRSMLVVAKTLIEANPDMESAWKRRGYRVYALLLESGVGIPEALDGMITKCRG